MSYGTEQIKENGSNSRFGKGKGGVRFQKKARHKWMRQKMKDKNFIPQYNRFQAGWYD